MNNKSIPKDWKVILDAEMISRAISRISYEILENVSDTKSLAIVGIHTGGEFLGRRLRDKLQSIADIEIPFGVIDITLYRDDLSHFEEQPTLKGTDLHFPVSGATIVLVDDVLYTGRTVRAALDAIIDFGRPKQVQLAILVDRGHRELPIRPDYIGKNIPTNLNQSVHVRLKEAGFEDAVYVEESKAKRGR